MEKIYIVYAEEDVYLVKASSRKEATDIIYKEDIEPYIEYAGKFAIKKSDLRVVLLDDAFSNKKFIGLT